MSANRGQIKKTSLTPQPSCRSPTNAPATAAVLLVQTRFEPSSGRSFPSPRRRQGQQRRRSDLVGAGPRRARRDLRRFDSSRRNQNQLDTGFRRICTSSKQLVVARGGLRAAVERQGRPPQFSRRIPDEFETSSRRSRGECENGWTDFERLAKWRRPRGKFEERLGLASEGLKARSRRVRAGSKGLYNGESEIETSSSWVEGDNV